MRLDHLLRGAGFEAVAGPLDLRDSTSSTAQLVCGRGHIVFAPDLVDLHPHLAVKVDVKGVLVALESGREVLPLAIGGLEHVDHSAQVDCPVSLKTMLGHISGDDMIDSLGYLCLDGFCGPLGEPLGVGYLTLVALS